MKYSAIKEAVAITSKRFPYFSVSLGSGIFWHFLEFNDQQPRIQLEEKVPCTAFAVNRKNEPLYRILIKGKNISVEFSHILTDGGGAFEYMKSLLYTYFKLSGKTIEAPGNIITPETSLSEEEYEDAYNKFFKKLPPPSKLSKAWHIPFSLNGEPKLKVLHAEVKVDDLLGITRNLKVTVTEYFVAVFLFSLQKIFVSGETAGKTEKRRVLRVEVPVNMRNMLKSSTMRNFSLFVLPEIDLRLGTYSFEEVLKAVHHQLQMYSEVKQILRFLSSNVSYEKLFIIRMMPLFIKKMAIAAIYRSLASKRFTGVVTNLGRITLPYEMEEMVESLELIPPPPNLKVKVTCALVSYRGKLRITFCNITQSNELERHILKHFSESGIHVRILDGN